MMLSTIQTFNTRNGAAIPLGAAALLLALIFPGRALAGYWEYSVGFSFHRSQYTEQTFSWTRTWGSSVSYQFDNHSGVEVGYQNTFEKQQVELSGGGNSVTKLNDQVLSASWVLNLTPRKSIVRPYFRVGVGQVWRTGEIDGSQLMSVNDAGELEEGIMFLSGVLAAGMKIYLVERIALRVEASTYLEGARISTWQDNVHFNAGVSIYF